MTWPPRARYAEAVPQARLNTIMQPILPALPASLASALRLAGNPPAVRAWQVGAVLQAQVVTDTVNNQVTLRIGTTTLEAHTQTPLTAGQSLSVEVVKLGEQPLLKILQAPRPAVTTDPVAAALRAALPKQTALTPLLANLGLIAQAGAGLPPLPAPVMAAALQIYRALTDSHQAASARGLQQAVRDTGIFLESKLAQLLRDGSSPLGNDFKAALLRLQAALNAAANTVSAPASPAARGAALTLPLPATPDATPPMRATPLQTQATVAATLARLPMPAACAELQRQTEGSLARVQLHQLAALPDGAGGQPVWLLELPIRHDAQIDLFHLRIARDGQHRADEPSAAQPWSVNLAFDLPGLGPVQARVSIQGEQVSTRFWAERPGTVQAFNTHFDVLRANLRQAGLGVGEIACHPGPAPTPPSTLRPPLMDIHA